MHNPIRTLQAFMAMLYLGPLLAGLGGFGWALVPFFAVIFILWLAIMRPQEWPGAKEWARPETAVHVAARIAVQMLLVTVCFSIGRGIGGVLGFIPPIPDMMPVAISFMAIPLTRLFVDPRMVAAVLAATKGDMVLATALEVTAADALIAPLAALPDDVDEVTLRRHVTAVLTHLDRAALVAGLARLVAAGKAGRAALKALDVVGATPLDA